MLWNKEKIENCMYTMIVTKETHVHISIQIREYMKMKIISLNDRHEFFLLGIILHNSYC